MVRHRLDDLEMNARNGLMIFQVRHRLDDLERYL